MLLFRGLKVAGFDGVLPTLLSRVEQLAACHWSHCCRLSCHCHSLESLAAGRGGFLAAVLLVEDSASAEEVILAFALLGWLLLLEKTEIREVDEYGCLWEEFAGPHDILPLFSGLLALEELIYFFLLRL